MPEQFVVPQFIDVEDKIFGPIGVRQFITLLAGGLLIFVEYKLTDFTLFVVEAIPTVLIFGSFAFLKVNGQLLHLFLLNLLYSLRRPSLRVWQPQEPAIKELPVVKEKKEEGPLSVPVRPTQSRLAELSLIVDTGGSFAGLPPNGQPKIKI